MSSLADRLRIAGKGRHSDVMPSIQVNTGIKAPHAISCSRSWLDVTPVGHA